MQERYLLYIDILGFSDLVKTDYGKIKILFDTVNNLHVHRHYAFQTIVFSDTILIFNKDIPASKHEHEYVVMYACEFVKDLMCRCVDLELQFRSILTYGEFYFQKLSNIDAYHGTALVNAYNAEKNIDGIGLFIDKNISKYSTIFKTTSFDNSWDFVYLTQGLERLREFDLETLISSELVNNAFYDIEWETKVLKTLKKNIGTQSNSKIRSKYLQTYYMYKQRYEKIIEFFEANGFDYNAISHKACWENTRK